jgi:hypothetical protein
VILAGLADGEHLSIAAAAFDSCAVSILSGDICAIDDACCACINLRQLAAPFIKEF